MRNSCESKVLPLPTRSAKTPKPRKADLNKNRNGSVRRINGQVYVDFMYLDERVRESSGLTWNEKNARVVRDQLDRIIVAIKAGTFRFAETFPESKKRDFFRKQEMVRYGFKKKPEEVRFREAA